jgi:hypothetical protein
MKTTPKHTMPPGYHDALKTALHGIPKAHIVDRNIEKARTRPVVSLLRYVAFGVAASLALMFFFNTAPSDPMLSEITAVELYELGYVEVEDIIDLTESDSLSFLNAPIELELLLNYTNPDNYIYEL